MVQIVIFTYLTINYTKILIWVYLLPQTPKNHRKITNIYQTSKDHIKAISRHLFLVIKALTPIIDYITKTRSDKKRALSKNKSPRNQRCQRTPSLREMISGKITWTRSYVYRKMTEKMSIILTLVELWVVHVNIWFIGIPVMSRL